MVKVTAYFHFLTSNLDELDRIVIEQYQGLGTDYTCGFVPQIGDHVIIDGIGLANSSNHIFSQPDEDIGIAEDMFSFPWLVVNRKFISDHDIGDHVVLYVKQDLDSLPGGAH